ncbi:MFS transporter [Bacillus sp. Soil745]|uniref:MFS transporter n=1 Tax=Peribacillus frigoritolerans TaxID=450367 RepID=UPI00070940BB|nr:MFS transporter [Peribacillus frigoritolerans]KRF51399.1 MFS transporter [Bacillus sp. Soil745]CAH0148649.1 Purine efflux pump PbuE [Peribacillus frigoritolerans]
MSNTWKRKIYLLTLISLLVGTSQNIFVGILDQVADYAGVTVPAAGQLVTLFALANAIGTPIIILATAKLDQRKQMILALSFTVLGCAITVVLPGFGFLMLSRIVLGIGMGVFIVTAFSLAAKLAPPGHQASALATVTMGFSASLVIGVPIGRLITETFDWKVIFWGIGLLCLLAIFAVAKMIPATKGEAPVPLGKQLALLKNPKITFALSVTFFLFIGYAVFYTYITPFLNAVSPMSERAVSLTLFIFGIATLIGSKLGGFMTDRLGIARTLFFGMSVNVLALILLSTIAGPYIVTFVLLMVWAMAAWTSGPTLQYNLVSLAPEASGIILSLNSSVLQLGMATGAGIGGLVTGGLSIQSISLIGAASVVIAISFFAISFGLFRSDAKVRSN